MMIMMFKGGKNEKCCERNEEVDNNPKTIEWVTSFIGKLYLKKLINSLYND
ncbi:hypothetical protein [Clostridium beijerinckii]|uniref:hypothetical protein n=1 Tax=Clostridium beijerinckii TaxID=1520 RepID=UPI0009C65F71|nr:hypothetical protein [Clostridium beijerinckii]MBA8937034.1 hypothetical protein [Clostridium beijerinckii]NRU40501.1 hypothetical protein [Clostridium beijerinckii]NSA96224.1 hypothetical protein [Clostridium beijerinckii]OOM60117.1 hypothetical protein CLOBI_32110 [Clostridium beijerinckii]OOM68179.1 hypothetical protein CLBEIC_35550 [Clostridium beijerinckii]